jgi:hypothetical protein
LVQFGNRLPFPGVPFQRRGLDFLDERVASPGENDNLIVGILADVEKGWRQLFMGLGSEHHRAVVGMQSDLENPVVIALHPDARVFACVVFEFAHRRFLSCLRLGLGQNPAS